MDETAIAYHEVAKIGDLEEEEVMAVFVEGRELCLYNIEGQYYATDGICTHEDIGLADGFVEGDIIECPLHGGKFEIKTGKPVNPPVTVPLRTYPVKIDGEAIFIGIEPNKQ